MSNLKTNASKRYGIRKRVWEQKSVNTTDLAEAMRDVDGELGKIEQRKIIEGDFLFTVNGLFLDYDHAPWGVNCIRVRLAKNPQQLPSSGGGAAHFEWTGSQIHVRNVIGLAVGTLYTLTFEVIG